MTPRQRAWFDACFDRVYAGLPPRLVDMIEHEIAVLVDDEPSPDMLTELHEIDGEPADAESLLGLHTGIPLTERSVEDHAREPATIHIFRRGLLAVAGSDEQELEHQIRVTLLHEIGHHFGLEEDDLDRLGYG